MLALDLVRSWSFARPAAPVQEKPAPINGPPSPVSARTALALSPVMRRQSTILIDMDIPSSTPTRAGSPSPNETTRPQSNRAEEVKPESDVLARKAGLGSLMQSAKDQVKVPEFDMGSFGF
jgi:hypothetical protein